MACSTDIKENRAKLISNARLILNNAEAENNRDLTADEEARWTELNAQIDKLAAEAAQAERKERQAALEVDLTKSTRKVNQFRSTAEPTKLERREAWKAWGLQGVGTASERALNAASNMGFDLRSSQFETRAELETTTSNAPLFKEFSSEYESKVQLICPIMSIVDTFETSHGNDYILPTTDDTSNSVAIVDEGAEYDLDVNPSFNKVTFKSWTIIPDAIVRVSLQMLQDSVFDLESFLAQSFGERYGRGYEDMIVSDNAGTTAPEGLLHSVPVGATLANGNEITLAKLIALETSVNAAYRSGPGCGWLMSDNVWGAIRMLADDVGFPIFLGDLQNSVQPRLLGYNVYLTRNLPSLSEVSSNEPVMLFGDFKRYRWRNVKSRQLIKLTELYARTGHVGFTMIERGDGRYFGHSGCVKSLNSAVGSG